MVCAMTVNSKATETRVFPERIVLASSSPRRADLLDELGVRFEVRPSPFAEPSSKPADVPAPTWAEALAFFKARSVASRSVGLWVLGADTIVLCGGRMLGKAGDVDEARKMLEWQAGRPAEVITGVALVRVDECGTVRRIVDHDVTTVWMRDDPAERERYLLGGEWTGKAGAYGIQDIGDRLIERIAGSHSNVVGLPIELVTEMLQTAAAERGL